MKAPIIVLSAMTIAVACVSVQQKPVELTAAEVEASAAPRPVDPRVQAEAQLVYQRARALDVARRCAEAKELYGEFADFIRPYDPRQAEMALSYAGLCYTPRPVDAPLANVTQDVARRYDMEALSIADNAALTEKTSPWLDYYRGIALARLGRTDEAAESFARAAERQTDHWAKSVALYARARVFADGHRCTEARHAYEDYADLVRAEDRLSANLALEYANQCR